MCQYCQGVSSVAHAAAHEALSSLNETAAVASPKPSWSPGFGGGNLTRYGYRWGSSGPQTVTYAFRSTGPTYNDPEPQATFTAYNATQIAATNQILQFISDVCGVTFNRVQESGSQYSNNAAVLFGNYANPSGAEAAYAYFPVQGGNASGTSSEGDVWTRSDLSYMASPTAGGYGWMAIMHEIGHTIGLQHPGEYNAGNGSPTYANSAEYLQDTYQYTIMSYWSEENYGNANFGNAYPSTLMMHDILALQSLYGVNTTTRNTNSTYGFNCTLTSREQLGYGITSAAAQKVFCIWDGGGTDTLDLSGYSQTQTISLIEGGFTSAGGLTNNISIAFGAKIEQAIGGSGVDTMLGNSLGNFLAGQNGNDILTGFAGNDTLNGGNGTDRAIYFGRTAEYTITNAGNGYFQITDLTAGRDGTDMVKNVEQLQFLDVTLNLSSWGTLAPIVSASMSEGYALAGTPQLLKSYVSPMDFDSTVTTVTVRDTTAGNGHLSLDGQVFTVGQNYQLTMAQFRRLQYTGTTAGQRDALVFTAGSNGQQSTAFNFFMNTRGATNAASVVSLRATAPGEFGNLGDEALVGGLFRITDANAGDGVRLIEVTQTGTGGSLWLGNRQLTTGSAMRMTAAEFNQLVFRSAGGPGTTNIVVRANDGLVWSTSRTRQIVNDAAGNTSTLMTMAAGQTFTGALDKPGDTDWVKISLTAGHQYKIEIRAEGAGVGTLHDSVLTLYNGTGTQIATNDDNGTNSDSALTYSITGSGSYFIGVAGYGNQYQGSYRLVVTDLTSSIPVASAPAASRGSASSLSALAANDATPASTPDTNPNWVDTVASALGDRTGLPPLTGSSLSDAAMQAASMRRGSMLSTLAGG